MTSDILIAAVTLLYLGTAISLFFDGKHGMALTFLAYAVANVGLIWSLHA